MGGVGLIFAKILLAPVLIWQGLHVRKHALILPEPCGQRSGCNGNGPRLRLLIIGDSSAAGVGANTQEEALSGHLLSLLSPHFTVEWDLVAKTGATTGASLQYLQSHDLPNYDVAIVALGVNDLTHSTPLWKLKTQQEQLMDILIQDLGVRYIYTSELPPMEAFPVLPQPLRWVMGCSAADAERKIASWQKNRPEITRLCFDHPFDPALMASDGFHPGPKAYQIWAKMLAQAILRDYQQETGGSLDDSSPC